MKILQIILAFCYNGNALTHSTYAHGNSNVLSNVFERAVFVLQTINVGGKPFNIFFDNGCGDVIVKKYTIDTLLTLYLAKQEAL